MHPPPTSGLNVVAAEVGAIRDINDLVDECIAADDIEIVDCKVTEPNLVDKKEDKTILVSRLSASEVGDAVVDKCIVVDKNKVESKLETLELLPVPKGLNMISSGRLLVRIPLMLFP